MTGVQTCALPIWARLNARHIGRFLPGAPSVIVQNRGGAAGKIGYGWFAAQAPADGTVAAAFGGALAQEEAVGEMPRDAPSIASLEIVASVGDTDVFFARREKLPEGAASLRSPRAPFAVAVESDAFGKLLTAQFSLFGLTEGREYKFVRGFPGGAEIMLAVRRGEIDFNIARIGLYRQAAAPEVAAGNWTPLWQSGVAGPERIRRNGAVADIPTFEEALAASGGAMTGAAADFVRWNVRANGVVRFIALPRGAPAGVVAAYVAAWKAMSADPAFLADLDRTSGIGPDAMLFGADSRAAIVRVLRER